MSVKRAGIAGLFVISGTLLVILFSTRILWLLGSVLVNDGPPQEADMVVVLGGDWSGNRILRAGELVRDGYAPKVLVSGAAGFFGHHESDLSIEYAVSRGFAKESFIPFQYPALATTDEEAHDVVQLRRLGVHRVLLVTSPWHTARALRVFHRMAPDLEVHAVESIDPKWHNGLWWKDREGRKIWLTETAKEIADMFRI